MQEQFENRLKQLIVEINNAGMSPLLSVLIDDGYRYVEITERDVSVIVADKVPFKA